MTLTAKFIEGGAGKILITVRKPEKSREHAVIVLPAFGEEMNKSRRLVWETASLLAAKGYLVIVPDLCGTGDSQGSFEDASWDTWLGDLKSVIAWAKAAQSTKFSALAVRFGATFLSPILEFAELEHVVAWQPIASGSEVLRSLVRTKSLNLRMAGEKAISAGDLMTELHDGEEPMLLSGYAIGPRLATDIGNATFSRQNLAVRESSMIVQFGKGQESANAGKQGMNDSGPDTNTVMVGGERFWLALEPGPNDELVNTTARFFPRL